MRLIFFNIGWMNDYNGKHGDPIARGGKYNNHSTGSEVCNFTENNGMHYGYVQPSGESIHIERLEGCSKTDTEIEGVTVIWTASPEAGGTVVIGWYEDAVVYRHKQKITTANAIQKDNGVKDFRTKALVNKSVLLPNNWRNTFLPRRVAGGMGQSNVWYADNDQNQDIVDKVLDLIRNFKKWTAKPPIQNAPSFYIIGSKYGRTEDVLPEMINNSLICTGFAKKLNLKSIIGKEYTAALLWIKNNAPEETGEAKRTLALFSSLKPGDLVAVKAHSAPKGKDPRLVIARYAVVSGRSKSIYSKNESLGHMIKVDFLDEQEPIELPFGYGKTLHHIKDKDRIMQLFGLYAESANPEGDGSNISNQDKATHTSEIKARGPYLMARTHNILQNELLKILNEIYGNASVSLEEKGADLLVTHKSESILIEVKSSPSPIYCIREALGQLLHYSHKLNLKGGRVRYVIVGPEEASNSDIELLKHIVDETHLPLHYCTPLSYKSAHLNF